MKQVTEKEWREKAAGLAEWRKNKTSPPNLDLYRKIVSMVYVGSWVADIGCGQKHLYHCLPEHVGYIGYDPFPIAEHVSEFSAEQLLEFNAKAFPSVFMLSALDNVKDLRKSLQGLKHFASENIVILTGIGIPPDENHTVQVDRDDLVSVLGEPTQEIEISPKVFLFEWILDKKNYMRTDEGIVPVPDGL